MPSNGKDPPPPPPQQTPSNSPPSKLFLHHLTTSPPRPSYLSQKAHIFAVQIPNTSTVTNVPPPHAQQSADPQYAGRSP
ncbi:hypothetical protein Q7P35_008807 [Cladosporium inversicolor]